MIAASIGNINKLAQRPAFIFHACTAKDKVNKNNRNNCAAA
jgi:hypothetical protein